MARAILITVCVVLVAMAGITLLVTVSPQANEAPPTGTTSSASSSQVVESGNDSSKFPPGVSKDGIENATRLMRSHWTVLDNNHYEEHAEWEEVGRLPTGNGTYRKFTTYPHAVTVEKGESVTEVRLDSDNDSTRYAFASGAVMVNYSARNDGSMSRLYEYSHGDIYPAQFETYLTEYSGRLVFPHLYYLDYELIRTATRNNRTIFTYESTGVNRSKGWATSPPEWIAANPPTESTTDEIKSTVTISQRGTILSFTVRESHSTDTDSIGVESTYTIREFGRDGISAPSWTTEEAAQYDVSLTGNHTVLALTHSGGPTAINPELVLDLPSGNSHTRIRGTIEADDTIYLYQTNDTSNRTLRYSINEQPTVNDSFVTQRHGNFSVTTWRNVFGMFNSSIQIEVINTDHQEPPVRERPLHPLVEHPLRTVHFRNERNETTRFEAWISEGGSSVTSHRESADSHTFDLRGLRAFGSGSVNHDPITAIDLPKSAYLYGEYLLSPDESAEIVMREMRPDEVLLVVIRSEGGNNTIRGFHGVNCGSVYLANLTLAVQHDQEPDVFSSSSCGPKKALVSDTLSGATGHR